jgi:hypothetical protein
MALVFDEDKHEYYDGPSRLPSVTQVLESWHRVEVGDRTCYFNHITKSVVPAYIFEAARDRGNAVHKILEYMLTGQGVDTSALDSSLHGYYRAICMWMDHYKPEPILIEKPLHDHKLRYAGKLDFYGKCKGIKNNVLADGKSGDEGPIGAQTAAYENLARRQTKYRGLIDRYALKIGDGFYTFTPCGSPTDFTYFRMRLSLYNLERRTA